MNSIAQATAFDWDLDEHDSDEADYPVLLCTVY